ncbi:DUF3987 domain-containing protein [Aeromonas veronii]|uniref:DUF3987 domain-containing protein n=1 Tax=Aeromonas veronii TaxID=654 RepID=UPI003D1F6B70
MMQPSPFYLPPYIASQMCNLLPLPLQHVVTELRQLTQANDDIIINSIFSAMSVAVQISTDILHPFTHKPIPLSLYCITVAESGARKSTVDNILTTPFRNFEQRQHDDEKTQKKHYEHDMEIYEIRLKLLKTRLKKAMTAQNKEDEVVIGAELQAHKETKPVIGHPPRILVSDITQPALRKMLHAPWNYLCLNTEEAGKILTGKDFSMPSFYNTLWDATPLTVERVSTGRSHIHNYRFSMNLMLQPSAFAKYVRLHGEQAKESGFFARCLFAFPQPSVFIQTPNINQVPTPNLDNFLARITSLLDSSHHRFLCGQINERRLLMLQDTVLIYDLEHLKESYRINICNNDPSQPPQFIQRATEHTLRLAGVMHAFLAGNDDNEVKSDLVNSAIELMKEYSRRHQVAVDYHEVTEQLLQKLLTYIQQHSHLNMSLNTHVISKSTLFHNGPSKLRKKEQLDIALTILESRGEIQRQQIGNITYIIPFTVKAPPSLLGSRIY